MPKPVAKVKLTHKGSGLTLNEHRKSNSMRYSLGGKVFVDKGPPEIIVPIRHKDGKIGFQQMEPGLDEDNPGYGVIYEMPSEDWDAEDEDEQ